MKPNFIGIGAHKCASTWVYRLLQEHPQAFVSQPKEINFFSKYTTKPNSWYEGHFVHNEQTIVYGEISVSYFSWPGISQRIRSYDPKMRLVLTLRDPVQRAFSHHLFFLQQGDLNIKHLSFEAGLEACGDYLDKSLYAHNLEQWLNLFPRHQMLVLFQEDIASQPQIEAVKLFDFLDLDPEFQPDSLTRKVNQSYLPRSRYMKSIINAGTHLAEKLGCSDSLWKLRQTKFLSWMLELNKQNIRDCVPEMLPETRDRLEKYFMTDVLETARILEVDSLPWPTWLVAQERSQS